MSASKVLVVGGAGFIGSHTAKLLSRQGYEPVVYDNLSTGHRAAVRWGAFVEGDILDTSRLVATIEEHNPVAMIHFAASAYVGESVEDPAKYYRNNVCGTQSLLDACRLTGTRNVIFSSSCATYGIPGRLPIGEGEAQHPINPYGRTKLIDQSIRSHQADRGADAYRLFGRLWAALCGVALFQCVRCGSRWRTGRVP
jgi:UDP-arabinose 4-epimerase